MNIFYVASQRKWINIRYLYFFLLSASSSRLSLTHSSHDGCTFLHKLHISWSIKAGEGWSSDRLPKNKLFIFGFIPRRPNNNGVWPTRRLIPLWPFTLQSVTTRSVAIATTRNVPDICREKRALCFCLQNVIFHITTSCIQIILFRQYSESCVSAAVQNWTNEIEQRLFD